MERTSNDAAYAELDLFIDSLPSKEGALITTLHKAQDIFGYLPTDVQNHVAHRLHIAAAKVYGVVTFYSFFSTKKKGKYKVNVCMGTACFVRGVQDVVDEFEKELGICVGQTSEDGLFSLDTLRCVGACGLAPVVSVNSKVFGRVTRDDVRKIVEEHMVKGADTHE